MKEGIQESSKRNWKTGSEEDSLLQNSIKKIGRTRKNEKETKNSPDISNRKLKKKK